jgi:WD40 repeat protein
VIVWDLETRVRRLTLQEDVDDPNCLLYTPDGKSLFVADSDSSVKGWDIGTGKRQITLKGHARKINGLAITKDGKILASASDDATIKLWDLDKNVERATLRGHSSQVWSVAFASDGKTLASASEDGTVRIWNIVTGKECGKIEAMRRVQVVTLSNDGKTMAAAGADIKLGLDELKNVVGPVKLWDSTKNKELAHVKGHESIVRTAVFAPDCKVLATGGHDHTVRLWDVSTGEEKKCIKIGNTVWCLAFSRDGKTLAIGSEAKTIMLVKIESEDKR